MKRRTWIQGIAAGGALFLTGCATRPRPLTVCRGKFALTIPQEGTRRHEQGQYEVSTYPEVEVWRLMTPLGATIATITLEKEGATLQLYNGKTYLGTNPDALLSELFGMPIPVMSLRAWLHTPAPQPEGPWTPVVLSPGVGTAPWGRLRITHASEDLQILLTQSPCSTN